MKEEWKEYKTQRLCFKVSNLGNVDGAEVTIKKDGRRHVGNKPIYKLVDTLFRGDLPKGMIVHHIDFNKLNDSLDNLQRITRAEHAAIHGNNMSEETRNKHRIIMTGENNPFYGKTHSIEFKKRHSERISGINNPMYGKHHTEITREKMSKALSGENHPMYGKHHTDEWKQKCSELHKGNKNVVGRVWVNNGIISKMCLPDEIPEGFVTGRLKH